MSQIETDAVRRWKRIEKAAREVVRADLRYGQTLKIGTRVEERGAQSATWMAIQALRKALNA